MCVSSVCVVTVLSLFDAETNRKEAGNRRLNSFLGFFSELVC